ncbi:MAG: response regulator [Desulfomonile sp.]|nr:response regulator [Desulfomonile sp.]
MPAAKIMIVEDEVVVAMQLRETLHKLGYHVAGIEGQGEEAVEKVDNMAPDLILMDIKLAGKVDGIEAVHRIARRHEIPVVYLTAHSDEMTLHRAKRSAPYGYLLKPFSTADLRAAIEMALHKYDRERSRRQTAMLFSQVVEFNGGAALAVDEYGVIRHMNALAETLTGWNRAESLGRPLGEVYVLKDRAGGHRVEFGYSSVSPVDETRGSEFVLVRKDNGEIIVQAEVLTLTNPSGRGAMTVHCFWEKTRSVASRQDWFSHAVNLRLAGRLASLEGNYTEAESFLKRALKITEENLGAVHPKVAAAIEDLPEVLRHLGKTGEAELLERRRSQILDGREGDSVRRPSSGPYTRMVATSKEPKNASRKSTSVPSGKSTHGIPSDSYRSQS